MTRTITDLLAEVPEGQSRLFKAKHPSADEDRFVEVWSNLDYEPYVSWSNRPEFGQGPWMGARVKPRIGLDTLTELPDFRFKKKLGKLVDFIQPGSGAYLISPIQTVAMSELKQNGLVSTGSQAFASQAVRLFRLN